MRDNLFLGWIALFLFLGGCSARTVYVCPPLVKYTFEQQASQLDQINTLEEQGLLLDGDALSGLIEDYGATRDAIRSCLGKKNAAPYT